MISYGAVNLWKLERADLGDHYRWSNNDNLRRLVGGPPRPRSSHDIERWFQSVCGDESQEIFALKTSHAATVGWIQLFSLNHISGSAEVGLVIDEDQWGRGYGHDALVALTRYAFEDLRLHRLGAEILSINLPSRNLFQRIGFVLEGVKREAFFTSGRFLDVEIFGLLSRDFVLPSPRSAEPVVTEP